MAELDILDVERHAAAFARHIDHLIGIDEQDPRLRIEEAADQPGAGNAVDLRPPPRDPDAWTLRRQTVELRFRNQRQPGLGPAFIAAFEHTCVDPVRAQLRCRSLAHFMAGLAGENDWLAKFSRPLLYLCGIAPDRARQQMRRLLVGIAPPDVDELHFIACGDGIPEIFRRDRVAWRQHESPPFTKETVLGPASLELGATVASPASEY